MRKITSLSLGISFLIMSYTGIMLFIVPHGRVAYWSDWHLWGLSKGDYGNIHTTSMVVFLIFGFLHIYYNWKVILKYLKNKQKKISFTKKEFLIALVLNIIFFVGTLNLIGPFKAFIDMEEKIKDNWTQIYGEPPYGHAEETKLKVFCKKLNINLNEAKVKLKYKNIKFDENEPLKTIAKNNNMAPNKIYDIIKNDKKKSNIKNSIENSNHLKDNNTPTKLGRRTLIELSNMGKINLEKAIEILTQKGIKNIKDDNRIKNLADELELTPLELYQIIRGK